MSITTEIQRVNGGKNAIRTLARQKNVNIPSTSLIDSYASVLGEQWPDCTFNVNYDGDKIRGKTMKWNQLSSCINQTSYDLTFTGDKTTLAVNGTPTSNVWVAIIKPFEFVQGNKYLFRINCLKYGNPGNFFINNGGWQSVASISLNVRESVNFQTAEASSSAGIFYQNVLTNVAYDEKYELAIANLTVLFGAGNEPSSASDPRIQSLIQWVKDRPDYDAGSLVYSFYKGTKLGEYDYIDTTNNKLVIGGAEVDISRMSLTRFLFGSNYLFYATNNDQETNTTNVISADYQTAGDITDIPDMSVTGNGGTGKTLWFRDDSCTTVEQFKAKNAGKKVYFKLATPTEIDL